MDLINEIFANHYVMDWLTEFLHSDIAKMTLAFAIAARLHRSWVRKDMAQQFSLIRESIDHVADVMSSRIDNLDNRIGRLESRNDEVQPRR